MELQDVAQYVVPGVTALAGAAYGARHAGISAQKAELRSVLDDASASLERASYRETEARRLYNDGAMQLEEGEAAIALLRAAMEEATQLRAKLLLRVPADEKICRDHWNAMFALQRATHSLRVAHLGGGASRNTTETLDQAEMDFTEWYVAFIKAARERVATPTRLIGRRR